MQGGGEERERRGEKGGGRGRGRGGRGWEGEGKGEGVGGEGGGVRGPNQVAEIYPFLQRENVMRLNEKDYEILKYVSVCVYVF